MLSVSDNFLKALRTSHTMRVQVNAYRGGVLLASNLPVQGGSVSVDYNSQIRRTLSLTVGDPAWDPGTNATAALAPFGSELEVKRGIRFPDGTVEWVPLGWFRVQESSGAQGASSVSVTAADRSSAVQDARFTAVRASNTALTIPAQIAALITEVLPTVTVTNLSGSTSATPAVFWEEDRWQAIDELAKSIGCVCYFKPDGNAVIEKMPAVTNPVQWQVDAGQQGVMVTAETSVTREGTYNAVVASGENSGDTAPVAATVTDNDATSPTYWGGPFGQKPRFYVSPLITTAQQATDAATSMLGQVRGLARQLTLSSVPNPALEAGDVIRVVFPDGTGETHLIDQFEVPLEPAGAMPMQTRSSKPTLE